ncbi:GOLPH3/VPS74 family protein [Rhodococcus zopfii]|uniref:GOLPH3/VPS74 family protein n=1 Tax=Rhodococcus zopfii TaxID=43772 RepID=UPI000932DC59|nr:GPP34 family phosphoprotein [Rhodococcus zopfii]
MTLLAEDLLLVLLDDESGKAIVDGSQLPRVLAGAVLLELALAGTVTPALEGAVVRKGRLVVRPDPAPADPVLADATRRLADAKPMKPASAIEKLAKGLQDTLLERIADRGWVREDRGRILGLFPTRRWPAVDESHERNVRAELRAALVDGLTPSPRTAALVSMLSAVSAAPKIFPDADKRAVKRRAEEIAEGEWAGAAVRRAVEAVNAAMIAAVTAGAVAASSG